MAGVVQVRGTEHKGRVQVQVQCVALALAAWGKQEPERLQLGGELLILTYLLVVVP